MNGIIGVIWEWTKAEYKELKNRVASLMEETTKFDVRGDGGRLLQMEMVVRKAKFGELWRLFRNNDTLLVQ